MKRIVSTYHYAAQNITFHFHDLRRLREIEMARMVAVTMGQKKSKRPKPNTTVILISNAGR
jgi:hypothetical protein